jgi:hypothetical protein
VAVSKRGTTGHGFWGLPSGARERKKAETELGGLLFDVEGQHALTVYLRAIYGARLRVTAAKGSVPTLLRLTP